MWVVAVAAAMACAVAGSARAQDAAGSKKATMMAVDADPGWEVATVRPSDPDDKNQSFDVRGRHIVIENQPVEMMLLLGYGVQKSQIVGVPEWVRMERFTVDGVPDTDGQPNVRQIQSLIRKLLEERFGMKVHREQREMPVYALTVAKGGTKMTPSTGDPNGLPSENGGGGGNLRNFHFTNTSMLDLALFLLVEVDRPVVDHTGVQGRYDFPLKFIKDDANTVDPNAPPRIFTAIQEQVGLKLEPMKAPADVIMIDRIERPSAN
jgi:uncharacterized protein (TIGR03435 family)